MINESRKIGRRLRRHRRLMRYKQLTVARRLGYNCCTQVSRWEQGKALPSLENAIKLSRLYGTTVNQLFLELHTTDDNELFPKPKKFDNGP